MDSPSWSDAFHSAFSSCLHCFHSPSTESLHNDNQSANNPQRPRHLESLLEPLLTDPGDTDNEAETVSLHSNIGGTSNRRRNDHKRTKRRGISLFGFDLFGKRSGAIQLSESEDDDEYEALRRSRRSQRGLTSSRSLTFDGNISDAAPLDSAAIDERVVEEQEQLRAAQARQKQEKKERRRKRKEKKELKSLAQALAQNVHGGELEFEGFQGSGDHISSHSHPYPHIPSPFQQGFLQSPDPSPNPGRGFDDYGPFHGANAYDDDADFDGSLYAARKEGSSVSGGGSDSRRSPGGTSASRSDHSQSPSPSPLAPTGAEPKKKKKSKKSSSNSNSSLATSSSKTKSNKSRSSASATSSDQPSLASPIYSPSPLSEGFSLPMKEPTLEYEDSEFSSPGLFNIENRNFPSAGLGFGGNRSRSHSNSAQARSGAFLASRD